MSKNQQKKNKKERKSILRQKLYEEYYKIVPYPHLLELEDVKSPDVVLLNKLKGTNDTVKVIDRWKYKHLFPKNYKKKEIDFGIPHDLIPSLGEVDGNNRVYPKLGLTSINPQKLSKLFEPLDRSLTGFGEIFDFTWEFEIKQCVPGRLSHDLKKALGIREKGPPPWLFKMQELGPPPGWPNVLYPGVNTDIPTGCVYGYEPNGWGKQPNNVTPRDLADSFVSRNQYTSLSYLDDQFDKVFIEKDDENVEILPDVDNPAHEEDEKKWNNKEEITHHPLKPTKKKKLTTKDKLKKKFKL